MERPTEIYELPSGIKVELYSYLTVRDKREVLQELGDMDLHNPSTKDLIVLQESILSKLLVNEVVIDDLQAAEGDYLYEVAMGKFSPDPNVLSELEPKPGLGNSVRSPNPLS